MSAIPIPRPSYAKSTFASLQRQSSGSTHMQKTAPISRLAAPEEQPPSYAMPTTASRQSKKENIARMQTSSPTTGPTIPLKTMPYARSTVSSRNRQSALVQSSYPTSSSAAKAKVPAVSRLPHSKRGPSYQSPTKASRARAPRSYIFRFLALPAEIRNAIYEYAALGSNNKQFLNFSDTRLAIQKDRSPPALLLVNKQISTEAKGYYVRACRFEILVEERDAALTFVKFLSSLSRKRLERLTLNENVTVRFIDRCWGCIIYGGLFDGCSHYLLAGCVADTLYPSYAVERGLKTFDTISKWILTLECEPAVLTWRSNRAFLRPWSAGRSKYLAGLGGTEELKTSGMGTFLRDFYDVLGAQEEK